MSSKAAERRLVHGTGKEYWRRLRSEVKRDKWLYLLLLPGRDILGPLPAVYDAMLMNGTLNAHLEEVDRSAEEMMDRLMTQLADQEGITELLKAENQLEWVQRMNSIQNRVEEILRRTFL